METKQKLKAGDKIVCIKKYHKDVKIDNTYKINKIIASVTIIYNPTIFKPKLWEDLIKNENIDEITQIINNLSKEAI